MKTPRINQQIKQISFLIIFLSAVLIASAAIARADGILTSEERYYGNEIAWNLCDYFDSLSVTDSSTTEAVRIIYQNTPNHMDVTDAVDIINYVVSEFCPSHWNDLVRLGDRYRNAARI